MTLTNAQRAALRRAISASPQWPAYRRANGNLTTADLRLRPRFGSRGHTLN
jgi:hypothetical protein